jgi:hypothetical protein
VISVESLRGYVLEEVIARLLYANGYRLLVSKQQDPDALNHGAHGLLLRGRGTDHQADVLGELTLPVPFSLPLRIFVEAKYRGTKANLRDVRNAHGVIHDVNEQYATAAAGSRSVPMRRYHYRYTLFSAAGFSRPAQQYALAQQISLVDLSSPTFAGLLDSANQTAQDLHRLARDAQVSPFPRGQMRTALRLALGTWTADEPDTAEETDLDPATPERRARHATQRNPAQGEPQQLPAERLAGIAGVLADGERGDLLLGFPTSPFVLALRPEDPTAFPEYVARHGPDVRVNIEFATRREVTGDWVIIPADGSRGFQLRFALPTLLEDWLLRDDGAAALRARDVKAGVLSSIAVFHKGQIVRLLFEPQRRV